MANERNLAALKAALDACFQGSGHSIDTGGVAYDLARRGVLAPSALTPQDVADLFHESEIMPDPRDFRGQLEQVARG